MNKLPLDRNCFVTSITLAFISKYGLEALEWDPLIVRDAFEGGFGFDKMPQRMFDKLNCGLSLLGTSLYTDSIEGFLTGTACMNNQVLDDHTISYCTLQECAWGIWEYINLNGDLDKESKPTEKFCPDIIKYIQEAGKTNGVVRLPLWMGFAQLPDDAMPDLSGDVDLFQQYMARQDNYIDDLNGYVNYRQKLLADELKTLESKGFFKRK